MCVRVHMHASVNIVSACVRVCTLVSFRICICMRAYVYVYVYCIHVCVHEHACVNIVSARVRVSTVISVVDLLEYVFISFYLASDKTGR